MMPFSISPWCFRHDAPFIIFDYSLISLIFFADTPLLLIDFHAASDIYIDYIWLLLIFFISYLSFIIYFHYYFFFLLPFIFCRHADIDDFAACCYFRWCFDYFRYLHIISIFHFLMIFAISCRHFGWLHCFLLMLYFSDYWLFSRCLMLFTAAIYFRCLHFI